jgi:hypothetical protein
MHGNRNAKFNKLVVPAPPFEAHIFSYKFNLGDLSDCLNLHLNLHRGVEMGKGSSQNFTAN